MAINNRTSSRNYAKPNVANLLSEDVVRLSEALDSIDTDVAALQSKAPLASPALTGTPSAPTPAADTNTTQLATTAFVLGQASAANPVVDGTAAAGSSSRYARADHVHPTDTSRAPLASPTFTGTPAAPTPAADTNTTQLATTAFVVGQNYTKQTRTVFAGAGLTGGGDLSANRTISADVATQAEAEAGSSSAKLMTPQRTAQAIVASGPLAGFRNAIINGNFDIWQRGTSFDASDTSPAVVFTADRWRVLFDGSGGTRTITRQAFTLGQTDVSGEPEYFLRFAQSVAGSGATRNRIDHLIENVRTFAGQQVTISFWAKAAANTTMPSVVLSQFFGTGGSPSAGINATAGSSLALTTAWQKFSYQVSLASISGKTLGTDNNHCLVVVWNMPLNATFTIDIAQVQLEPGPVDTPFERRPVGMEQALCQRYYEVSEGNNSLFSGNVTSGGQLYYAAVTFQVRKRANPTVTLINLANSNFSTAVGTINDVNNNGFNESRPSISTGVGHFNSRWTASAEL